MSSHKPKVFVAMSGGVDSSVAALLLKRGGYDVMGVHMICYGPSADWRTGGGCENNQDKQDAMRVSAKLKIPFLVWDFRQEYREAVFNYMVGEYATGHTPNPDVMCNREIKFGVFLERALKEGADYIATGHYVRRNDKWEVESEQKDHLSLITLHSALDQVKDQSYFLWSLTQDQLRHCLFPIGEYAKSEVRELAMKAGLPVAAKKDSQGLCFVGKMNFGEFLRGVLPRKHGDVLDSQGNIIGEHDGSQFYTLGQRHGLNIGGQKEPLYVAAKDAESNTLVVARGDADPILYRKELIAGNINWISVAEPASPLDCIARIRYRQPLQKCIIAPKAGSGKQEAGSLKIVFSEPQRAVAPGQSIVFYKENGTMLGGGIIK